MKCTLTDIRNKEVINIRNGNRLGYIDDVEIDTSDGKVLSFIIYGRTRFFGLFGREDDVLIKCEDIQIIGRDTVLVSAEETEVIKTEKFELKSLYK
jgi:YlmC/YmxH family sporulation protein